MRYLAAVLGYVALCVAAWPLPEVPYICVVLAAGVLFWAGVRIGDRP